MFTPNVLVAFEPLTPELGGDRLFFGESHCHIGDASHWFEPTKILAQRGRCCGIKFHTADVVNLDDAAVFIFGDMPASPEQVKRLRQDYPHLKIVLHILESPLRRDWIFDRRKLPERRLLFRFLGRCRMARPGPPILSSPLRNRTECS